MPVTNVVHDDESLTLTVEAEFAAPVERVWQIYADPRQLEKVWGPPTYPATVVEHDFRVGGRVHYYMTGPGGDRHAGWWAITSIDEPNGFAFDDGFSDVDFNPLPDMPVSHNVYAFTATERGTKATYVATFESAEALQKVLDMGIVEGTTEAINQIDALIA